jgi:hypothetical protein
MHIRKNVLDKGVVADEQAVTSVLMHLLQV